MAKIKEDIVAIKLSKLVKDSEDDGTPISTDELKQALEQVAQELVSDGVIVEVVAE